MDTAYSVRALKYQNGLLYSAEMEGGIAVYRISENSLTEIGRYKENVFNSGFSSIGLTASGRYLISQNALSAYRILDMKDPTQPVRIDPPTDITPGSMYYRNIVTGLVSGKYLGIYGRKNILWYAEDESGALRLESITDNSLAGLSEKRGAAAVGDRCLAVSTNGYRLLDPATNEVSTNYVVDEKRFNGKAVSDGRTLVVVRAYDGRVTLVDISSVLNPRVIAHAQLPAGADLPLIKGNTIFIPCRRYGLIKLSP